MNNLILKKKRLVTLLETEDTLKRLNLEVLMEITFFLEQYDLILYENKIPKSQHREILNKYFVNYYFLSVKEFEVIYSQFIISKY